MWGVGARPGGGGKRQVSNPLEPLTFLPATPWTNPPRVPHPRVLGLQPPETRPVWDSREWMGGGVGGGQRAQPSGRPGSILPVNFPAEGTPRWF